MVLSWGHPAAARPLLEESLTLCRQTNSPLGVAYALRDLIMTAQIDETAEVRALLDESLAIFREHGDIWGTARTLQIAARVSFSDGNYTSARRLFDEALAADEKLRFWPGVAAGLSELGLVSRLEGNLDRAHAYQDQAAALKRKVGGGTQNQTLEFGYLALERGGMQEAASFFDDAAAEYSAIGDHAGTCACLTGLAQLSIMQGDPRRAARLLGIAETTLERTATQRYWRDLPDYNQQLKAVRAALDPSTLAAEWALGRTQEPLEAIAAISNGPQPEASRPPTPPAAAPALTPLRTLKAQWGGLTRREREIARLVAQGKSNRQIAEEIVVSERTVDHHISNILSKLEFTSRTQVAAWAINKGLA